MTRLEQTSSSYLKGRTMDQDAFTMIAGAALSALLVIVLPKTLLDMRIEQAEHAGHEAQAGYTLPAPGKAGAAGAAATAAAAPAATGDIFGTVKPLLAAAKADGGAATFKICAACHSGEKGGANKVGPALWGVVGRKTGSVDGFAYSEAMKGKGGEWTYDRLAGFLNNPKGYVAGTKMVYNGVQDPEKLADLLAYLGTLSDSPMPLPK